MARDFASCLSELVKGGALDRKQADDLLEKHRRIAASYAADLGADGARLRASEILAKEAAAEAAELRRRTLIGVQAQDRLRQDVVTFRDASGQEDIAEASKAVFENRPGYARFPSLESMRVSILGEAHARMADVLQAFERRAVTGFRKAPAMLADVVKELHGEGSGSARARELAQAFRETAEWLRQRFNAAGGQIGRIENWFPHAHDALAVAKAGREKWKAVIRPLLAPERMRDPMTGAPIRADQLDDVLDRVYDDIATESWNAHEPAMQPYGKGALWKRHGDHRFLAFKSADDWAAYDAAFGSGDAFGAMMRHISIMARDIAALERLGPNPAATVEWLKQVVQRDAELARDGRPARLAGKTGPAGLDYARSTTAQLERLWGVYSGSANVAVNGKWAEWLHVGRQVFGTAASLGSGFITSLGDLGTAKTARLYAGAQGSVLADWIKFMATYSHSATEAARMGLILDSAAHVLQRGAREAKSMDARYIADYIADRVLNITFLSPSTQAGRHIHGMALMAEAADRAKLGYDDLDGAFRRILDNYGIGAAEWDIIRAAELYERDSGGFLRAMDVARVADENARRVADLYGQMIRTETEYAVPTGSLRVRAATTGHTRPGTFVGEALRSALQFRTFPLVITWLQANRIMTEWHQGGKGRAVAYGAALFSVLSFWGAASTQLRAITQGRDPEPMSPSNQKFWMEAMARGGGLGIFSDFAFADANRYGNSLGATLAGPIAGKAETLWKLTGGNVQELVQGKPTKFGKEFVTALEQFMPGGNMWYLQLGARRYLWDELRRMADPDAEKAWSEQMRKGWKERGRTWWWEPGQSAPARAPDLSNALASPPG